MKSFTGFPKKNFRQLMIDFWMSEGCFDSEADALKNYDAEGFDALCGRCDGTTLLTFTYDDSSTCFEVIDNNYVIPVTAIDIYKE